MTDRNAEQRARECLAKHGIVAGFGADDHGWVAVLPQHIIAAMLAFEAAAIERCAKIAEGTGRPVGMGDGDTYTVGTATQAAAVIRAINQGG